MAEVVNLRLARKRKRRADGEAKAAENRARHGQTGADTRKAERNRELQEKRLDAHRRNLADAPE